MKPTRRRFLAAAPALIGLTAKADRRIEGQFVNDAFDLGHRLRDRRPFAAPARQEKVPIVIVGAGMAGLSAAWRLQKRGFRDFVLLEMEPSAGGNSRWGESEITAYPWAAHYVPVPDARATLVRELFEELGVLKDGEWDERALCFAPQERLYIHGRWQEGIEPEADSSSKDRDDYRRFQARMSEFRASGEFTIPMQHGERPSPLDSISFADWLRANGFTSPYLDWYADYACRDDFGALARDTSAWAGIHYFASRAPEEKGPLTWPEGNGWIARRLIERVQPFLRTSSPVYAILHDQTRLRVRTEAAEYIAERVVFAAATFLAPYVIEGAPPAAMRQKLLDRDWAYWREAILNDLSRAHPDIRQCVARMDVMRIGRAMARPAPGFLGSAVRRKFADGPGPVYYANSDLSGFSIFEEAQYRGVTAADRALKDVGQR